MINHNKPTISKNDIIAINDVLKSGYISQGKKVTEFERLFSKKHFDRYALATSSGTSALHLALLSSNIHPGDEVIIPSYVCTALLNAIHYVGATPQLVDIDLDDFNLSPVDVKRKINRRTKAIIVPHLFGHAAKIEKLSQYRIPIIEDCAQSIGASLNKRPLGTFSDVSMFSFYSTKVITSAGEGGMILTKNKKLYEFAKHMRDYDEKRTYKTRYNYKMTDVSASMGISQLKQLKNFISARHTIASYYNNKLKNTPLYIERNTDKSNNYFRYLIRIERKQNEFVLRAKKENICIKKPIFKPLHKYFNLPDNHFTNTMSAWKTVYSIPIYPTLKKKEIDKIVSFLLSS